MRIAVPKETAPGERRVALVPESAKKLKLAGYDISAESGAGDPLPCYRAQYLRSIATRDMTEMYEAVRYFTNLEGDNADASSGAPADHGEPAFAA